MLGFFPILGHIFMFSLLWGLLSISNFKSRIYLIREHEQEGFWKRNKDKIFLVIIATVIGAVVGSIITYLITKLTGQP